MRTHMLRRCSAHDQDVTHSGGIRIPASNGWGHAISREVRLIYVARRVRRCCSHWDWLKVVARDLDEASHGKMGNTKCVPLFLGEAVRALQNIRALLTRGAKASAEDLHGNTPLHIAALNVGAWTPWDSIVESEHPQWVHVYSVHDARTCIHVCAESRAFVRILVNTQFRPHAYAHTPGGPKGSCPTNETSEAD